MPRIIELPSRGITVEFSDRATDEQIQDFLDREYPRSGQDVSYELGQDPKFHRSTDFTLEDYEMYRDYMSTSAQPGAWDSAYSYLSSTIKSAAIESLSNMGNPNPIDALKVLGTSFAAGTGDLVDLAARGFEFQSAEDTYQKHLEENKASDSESERKKYLGLLAKDHRDFKRQMDYQGFRQKIIDASPAPYLTEANTLWADPSVFITGGTSAVGKLGLKLATKAGSKLGTGVRKVGQTADKLGMLPERIAGAVAGEGAEDFVRGATTVGAGAGLAGIGAGPGVYAFGALKGGGRTLNVAGDMIEATAEAAQRGGRRGVLDQASELAETAAGQKILSGLSRIETPLTYGVEAGKGALYGGAIGGGLGFVAEGKDGFFHGLAMGSMMGAPAGVLGRGIADVTGFRYAGMSRDDAVKYLSSRPDAQFAVKALDRMSAEDAALIGDAVELGRQYGVRVEFHDDSQRPVGLDPSVNHTHYKGVEVGPDGVYINTDRMDGSTVAHEVFHSIGYHMGREQFVESIKGILIGQRDPVSGNLIREGDVPVETLKQFGRAYAAQFSNRARQARLKGKSEEADTLDRRASEFLNQIEAGDYSKVIDEFGAYYFDAFVRGEEPKILIGGEKDLVKNTLSWAKKKMAANFQRDIARQGMDFSQGVGEAFIRGDKRQFALPAFDKLIKRMIKDGSVDTTHRVPVTGIPTKEAYKLAQMHGAAHLFKLDASGQPIGAKTKGDLDAEFEADFDKVLEQLERLPSAVRRSRITEDAKGRKKLIAESITPEEAVILQNSIRHLNPYQRQMLMDLANGMTGDGGKQTYRVSYWKASGASRSKRKPYDQFEVSEREVLPFSLEMNKTGGLYFRFVDMDSVRGNLRKATRLSEYKNLYPNFKELEADFLRYLENLDSETPADSAAFLGGGETGVAKRNLFYEGLGIVPRKDARLKNLAREGYTPKRGRNFAFKSFRIERVGNMTPTGERVAFSDSRAYERGMENLMPDDGTVRAEPDQTFKQGVMRRHNGDEDARYMPSDGNDATRQVASEYMRRAGLRNLPHSGYLRPEESHLKELADWMQTADHRPNDPEVAASYEALKNEVIQQYETAVGAGLKAEPWEGAGEPYANSREMMADLKENGHMFFYRTENGFGESGMPVDHPMLEPVPFELNGRQLLLNDLFRIVHDYFGHTQQGFQFGPRGEYNAYKEHSAMFTEAAQGALAAETLAQNAWVNYGPHIRRKDGSVPAPQDRDYTHPSDRPFAEQKANVVPAEIRYMVDTPDVGRHIKGVGDTAENLRQAITRRPATGVAKNQSIRFHDESDRPIVIGSDQLHGGKNFDLWIEENQKWLTTEEVSDYRKWYSELRGEFEKEFGKRDADKMMMSWLGAQQNASPLIGMQNVFRVEDRLDGITSGKKGGLADEKIEYILKRKVPPKGFGAKLSDFVDAGYLRKTRTYVGGDPRGGQPFVADVHTGRDSGHVDHTTLSRLIEKSKVGKLFVDGTPVKVEATKTKKVLTKDSKGNKKVKIVPEEAVVNFEDGRSIAISRDMTGSPSNTVYEGISVWGNQLTDYLNKANYEGGNWTPAEVQAVGWMRVLRQYDLPQNSISETWMANTHRVSAELNYMMGNVLPNVFPDFQSLPQKAQERITRDVTTRAVQDLAKIIGGSLRVRQLNVGLGYWQGQRSPAVQAFVMGSPEAGAIFRDALAYVSEQDTSFMVTFGKGGKGKQAVSFSRLDGGQLNQSDVNSFIDFVEKQGKADSRLIKGFSAYATPDNKGLLVAGLTDKSAPKVYDLIKRWAEDSGLDIQAKKFSAVVEGSRNEWAKQKEGQGYLDGIVRRGGSERVRAIHDYRGRYFDLIEQAFKKHAPESLSQETSPSQLAQGRADFLKEPSRGNDPNARFMPDDSSYLDAANRGDTATAQRMVDQAAKAAGYTIGPVYHGTSEYGFNVFDKGLRGSQTGANSASKGFFFSTDKAVASGYMHLGEGDLGADLLPKIQSKQNQLNEIQKSVSGKSIEEIILIQKEQYDPIKSELDQLTRQLHSKRMARGAVIDAGGTPAAPESSGIYSVHLKHENPLLMDFKGKNYRPESFDSIIERAISDGHDSVVIKNAVDAATAETSRVSDIHIVFEPNQIKSADPITRDNAGNIIPLSERFQSSSDDIRFQPDIGGQDSLGMFSAAERATVDLKQEKGSASQMLAMIKKAGVKDEEIAELGLDKFLEGNRKVSKDEIIDYLVENQITVEETVLGGPDIRPKIDGDTVDTVMQRDLVPALESIGIKGSDEAASAIQKRHLYELRGESVQQGGAALLADHAISKLEEHGHGDLLQKFFDINKLDHEETVRPLETKHSSYVEPGADEGSYRELLLRLPEADQSALREKREAFNREMWKRYNHADPTGGDLPGWYQYATPEEKRTYRNLLNELDESRGYTDGHYDEYPNVLAHVRFNDRTSEYGKTLFLEEIQSDWHQKGRKMGYNLSAREYAALESEFKSLANDRSEAADVRRAEIVDIVERDNRAVPGSEYLTSRIGKGPMPLGVPDAPFKTSWHELTMKRMISYAAKHGYDAIAWTKGEAQFQRYGSEEIAWVKTSPNTWKVKGATQGIAVDANIEGAARARRIMKEGGKEVRGPGDVKSVIEEITRMQRSDFSPENYESHVDKMTNRIWSQMQSEDAGTSLPRKEGMEGFYDRMLPKMKTWKKLGLKVESGDLGGEPGNYDNVNAHIVKLTPEVKAKVLDTGIARFMPDASVPGAEKNSIGWSMILSKAGKWRVYDPTGALAGIASSKAVAERIFRTKYKRELRKASRADSVRFMPDSSSYEVTLPDGSTETFKSSRAEPIRYAGLMRVTRGGKTYPWHISSKHSSDRDTAAKYLASEKARMEGLSGDQKIETKLVEVGQPLAGAKGSMQAKVKYKFSHHLVRKIEDALPDLFSGDGIATRSARRGMRFSSAGGTVTFRNAEVARQFAETISRLSDGSDESGFGYHANKIMDLSK